MILYRQRDHAAVAYPSRMYYELISEVLPDVKIYIDTTGDGVSKVLPLESFVQGGSQE